MLAEPGVFLPRWPILVVVSLLLWVSTASHDLDDWVASVHLAGAQPIPIGGHQVGRESERESSVRATSSPWISELVNSVRLRQKRKLAMEALRREREEASDQARLDQVLKMVSERGTDALTPADKALLRRVSEHLRRQRESQSDSELDRD